MLELELYVQMLTLRLQVPIVNLNQVLWCYMFYQSEAMPPNRTTKHNKAKIVLGRLLIFFRRQIFWWSQSKSLWKEHICFRRNAKLQEIPVHCFRPTISTGQTKEAGTEFSKTFLVWTKNVGCIMKNQDYVAFLHLIKKDWAASFGWQDRKFASQLKHKE